MPETTTNGYTNGNRIHNGYEMEDNASFLFTSESVGEGHPGEFLLSAWKFSSRRLRSLSVVDIHYHSTNEASLPQPPSMMEWEDERDKPRKIQFEILLWKTCASCWKTHDVVAIDKTTHTVYARDGHIFFHPFCDVCTNDWFWPSVYHDKFHGLKEEYIGSVEIMYCDTSSNFIFCMMIFFCF